MMRDDLANRSTDRPSDVATIKRHGRRIAARSRSRQIKTAPRPLSTESTPAVEPNSLLLRLFSHAPEGFIDTFSDEQIAGLNAAAINADTRFHSIDFRTSLSFFGIPFYVTFLMGRERRSRERLAREGQTQIHRVAIAHIILTMLIGLALLAAVVCALYLFKSAVGIDLFDGNSSFHELFFE